MRYYFLVYIAPDGTRHVVSENSGPPICDVMVIDDRGVDRRIASVCGTNIDLVRAEVDRLVMDLAQERSKPAKVIPLRRRA